MQKREVAVVKQEGGAGPWGGGGDRPGGKVGGKVSLGRSRPSPRSSEVSGHWKEVCLKEEGCFCDQSGWCVTTWGS